MTDGQRQALRDAYTTLRAIRNSYPEPEYKGLTMLCATSEYLLVAEFPEVAELEESLNRTMGDKS